MHEELNAIRRVYGEPGTEGTTLDAGAEAEAASLAEMKTALDALPSQRPAPDVLDAVMAAASDASLGPIRTVYGEQPVALAAPEAKAEVAALAEVKVALDTLPSQRPHVAVLDAVVAAAGETTRTMLGPIRMVYGEEAAALATPEAEAEAAALAEVKVALDALPPQRPDPALIDAVVAAARPAHAPRAVPVAVIAGRAADRPVRRGVRRGAAVALSAAFALVLALSIGLWPDGESPMQEMVAQQSDVAAESPFATEEQEVAPGDDAFADAAPLEVAAPIVTEQIASAAPPSVARARQVPVASAPAPAAGFSSAAERRVVNAAPAEAEADLAAVFEADEEFAEALPLADGDAELQVLYLRLQEMQAAQVGVAWDGAPVSLGAAPDSTPAARSGWMQVRVER